MHPRDDVSQLRGVVEHDDVIVEGEVHVGQVAVILWSPFKRQLPCKPEAGISSVHFGDRQSHCPVEYSVSSFTHAHLCSCAWYTRLSIFEKCVLFFRDWIKPHDSVFPGLCTTLLSCKSFCKLECTHRCREVAMTFSRTENVLYNQSGEC